MCIYVFIYVQTSFEKIHKKIVIVITSRRKGKLRSLGNKIDLDLHVGLDLFYAKYPHKHRDTDIYLY